MKYFIRCVLLLLIVSQAICARANSKPVQILSPNKDIEVSVWSTPEGEIKYKIMRKGKLVLEPSQLGLRTKQQDFSKSLKFKSASANKVISKSYTAIQRSEEHTSELQSRENIVCRLLL